MSTLSPIELSNAYLAIKSNNDVEILSSVDARTREFINNLTQDGKRSIQGGLNTCLISQIGGLEAEDKNRLYGIFYRVCGARKTGDPEWSKNNIGKRERSNELIKSLERFNLEKTLKTWVNGDSNKSEASRRILEFVNDPSKRVLDLSCLELDSLPDIFMLSDLRRRLESLQLFGNKIQSDTIPLSLSLLDNLKSLNLFHNSLRSIPDHICMQNLEELILGENKITKLPLTIENLQNLKCLNLASNRLENLHGNIMRLKKLEFMFLDNNKFTAPPAILNNSNFPRLNLDRIGITNQNAKMTETDPVETIISWVNGDSSKESAEGILIDFIKDPQATRLDLSNQNIDSLPDLLQLGVTHRLTSLSLNNNQFENIPYSIRGLKELKVLELRSNKIKALPSDFCELKKLKFLEISGNEIEEIPHSIGKLKDLEFLYAADNELTKISESLGCHNMKLKTLHLHSNLLEELPKSLINLKLLKRLDISSNKLKQRPEDLARMSNIESIKYEDNPFSNSSRSTLP